MLDDVPINNDAHVDVGDFIKLEIDRSSSISRKRLSIIISSNLRFDSLAQSLGNTLHVLKMLVYCVCERHRSRNLAV